MNPTQHTRAQQGIIVGKHGYEQTVIARAMQRGGANPHLKGHIQEILVKDLRNARNVFRLNGASTQLTKSTTAGTVDLVTTKGGRVIERIQVKDVTSTSGINKLVKQCADGKYRSARLVGSEETTQAFNKAAEKAGITKRMQSSGVSTKQTTSLAQRAGASGSGSLSSAIGQAAKTGGAAGAALGAGIEVIKGVGDLMDGTADVSEVGVRVAKAGAKGGVSGAAAGASATAAGAATATALTALGVTGVTATVATVAAPLLVAASVGYLASEVFDWIFD